MEPAPTSGPPRTGLDKFFAEALAFDPNVRPATPALWRDGLRAAVVSELSSGLGLAGLAERRPSGGGRRSAVLGALCAVMVVIVVAAVVVVATKGGGGVPELEAVGSGPGVADAVGVSPDGKVSNLASARTADELYTATSDAVSGVQPQGAARLRDGSTVVARPSAHVLVRITQDGKAQTFAGTGQSGAATDGVAATSSELQSPTGLATGGGGDLYVSDPVAHVILKIEQSGVISRYAGTGSAGSDGDGGNATDAQLSEPVGMAVDETGALYIADKGANNVRKVDSSGVISTVYGTGDSGAGNDQLNGPVAVAVDQDGGVVIADAGNGRIVIVSNGSAKTKSEEGAVALTRSGSKILVLHGKSGSYKLRTVGT